MSFLDALRSVQGDQDIPPGLDAPKTQALSREILHPWDGFIRVEEALVARGWTVTSPFWKEHLYKFWEEPRRRFVGRVGRRGGKTSTICRVVVAEVLHSPWNIPFGDVGIFAIVSIDRVDSRKKVQTIHDILEVLGVRHSFTKDEITLHEYPLIIRTYVATIRSIVGFTSIGILADEVARWRDNDGGANPAKEVLASLRPSMKTQPQAHEYLISSPWGTDDAHFNAVEQGTNGHQYVCIGTTWEANPTPEASEEACHRDESDPMIFDREYAAIPMPAGTAAFFDPRVLGTAFTDEAPPDPPEGVRWQHVAGMDIGFSRDHSALVVVRLEGEIRRVVSVTEINPSKNPNVFSHVVKEFAEKLKTYGIRSVMADAHYRKALVSPFAEHGISITEAPMKPSLTYVHAKKLLSEGYVRMPPNRNLRKQLLSINSIPRSGGLLQIVLPRGTDGHCDAASALVLALYQNKTWYEAPLEQEESEEQRMWLDSVRAVRSRRDDDRDTVKYSEWDSLEYGA